MKFILVIIALFTGWLHAAPWATTRPKLIVVIVIDQFRADYISRFQKQFSKDGFLGLINSGAYYPYGEYGILQSMTGPGHATILTGAFPYQMGIPLNDWYDQKNKAMAYCVDDADVKSVGSANLHPGSSPKNLIGTTVGDELKNVDSPSKVVTLALKDRAAVLLGGHRPDFVFWFEKTHWVSSDYYRKDSQLPAWLMKHNATLEKCDLETPCGIQMTAQAFQAALEGEKLGQSKGTDLIAVSFSSHDFAGHHFGPNAKEMEKMTLAEDAAIAKMRAAVQARVPGGLKNVVFVLTGDHGVAPSPAYLTGTGIPAGRIDDEELTKELNTELNKRFGKPKERQWIPFGDDFNFYIDESLLSDSKIKISEVETAAKEVLLRHLEFKYVITRSEVEAHQVPPAMFEKEIARTYFPGRSGHIVGIVKPYYINAGKNAASHMTGYSYDRTVPIVFSGFGIKNGLFANHAEVIDIAPTLSFLLGILPPSLSEGRVLSEALISSKNQ